MDLFFLSAALAFLLALNAFFVLAEFAIVKVRPSRVAELIAAGNGEAGLLVGIQQRMDEYLSVCQVGITLASVALGMVGKKATDAIMGDGSQDAIRYALAIAVSYLLVSGSHIVVGELVPKSIAIRIADRAALWVAKPLLLFRALFFPVLWVLTSIASAVLHLFRVPPGSDGEFHSEDELRILLDHSQERGLLSFRQLLFMENIFDLGELKVRDAMRPRAQVQSLYAGQDWSESLRTIQESRFTRYPLLDRGVELPLGFVHVKDIPLRAECGKPDLKALARPTIRTSESTSLEALLVEMQRRRIHLALVYDEAERWTGMVTLEDVIEEIVGTIRDEFEDEEPVRLGELLTPEQIVFGIEAPSVENAIQLALLRIPRAALPLPPEQILKAVEDRNRLGGTLLGDGIAIPHARISGLTRPFLMVIRSGRGVTCLGKSDKARLLIVLLTPAGQPRIHQRLQSIITELVHESDYVKDRLLTAQTPAEVIEAIRTGEQASLG